MEKKPDWSLPTMAKEIVREAVIIGMGAFGLALFFHTFPAARRFFGFLFSG